MLPVGAKGQRKLAMTVSAAEKGVFFARLNRHAVGAKGAKSSVVFVEKTASHAALGASLGFENSVIARPLSHSEIGKVGIFKRDFKAETGNFKVPRGN